MVLPSASKDREEYPIVKGVLDYFPNAVAAVAKVSLIGNKQHNPGEPMHWAREKSFNHPDKIGRHLVERGTLDIDMTRHSAKVAWRALANLEEEILAEQGDALAFDHVMQCGTDAQRERLREIQPDLYDTHPLGGKKG